MAVWTTELAPPQPAAGKLAPISRWRIHIGAHKTATTHVQEILALMRPQLVERGIDFDPQRTCARSGFAKALLERRLRRGCPCCAGRTVRRPRLADALDPLRAGPAALVLSEEKLHGRLAAGLLRADLSADRADRPPARERSGSRGGRR